MINLLTALVAAKANFKPLRKDKKANYGKYASLDAVLESVESALLTQGLLISHQLIDQNLVTTLYHTSGEKLESIFAIGEINDPQKLGSKLTYYRRYAICGMLSICADEDDDGQATVAASKNQYNASGRNQTASTVTAKKEELPEIKPSKLAAAKEIVSMQPAEIATIKKIFMDLAEEKGVKNISKWVKENLSLKPSAEWGLADWELAIEKIEKLEVEVKNDE